MAKGSRFEVTDEVYLNQWENNPTQREPLSVVPQSFDDRAWEQQSYSHDR
jgi:hypothetical protein